MIVSTTFNLKGYKNTEYLGIVRGIIVRAPTIMQNFMGGLKTIVGGKIGAFTNMCETTSQKANDEMVEHAKQMGADAIVGMQKQLN